MSLNIASIDPGVTTGLVIALINPRVDTVSVKPLWIEDHTSQPMVLSRVLTSKCRIVFMEQKPAHPSKEGLDNWEWLMHRMLGSYKYHMAHSSLIQDHTKNQRHLFLIQPSYWKPFMKNRRALLPKNLPHHAKDAFMMLHYSIQINYPDKEIVYAK